MLPQKFDISLCPTDDAVLNWSYDSSYILRDEHIEAVLGSITRKVNRFYKKIVRKFVLKALEKKGFESSVALLSDYNPTNIGPMFMS